MLKEVKVQAPYFAKHRRDGKVSDTGNMFNRPTLKCTYIKILARCLNEAKRTSQIFPGVKNPMLHQIRDLCRDGYLVRLVDEADRQYYLTTEKGKNLILEAANKSL